MTQRLDGGSASLLSVFDVPAAAPGTESVALDRVVPLWIDFNRGDAPLPTLQVKDEVMTSANANWVRGHWQLHVYPFASEALAVRTTLQHLATQQAVEAGASSSGEGLLLLRVSAEGAFRCDLLDHRRVKSGALLGSWATAHALGSQAAEHIPDRSEDRATALARMVSHEFQNRDERGAAQDLLLAEHATRRSLCSISLLEVVDAANKLLEPVEREVTVDDRVVLGVIERHLAGIKFDKGLVVRQIAQTVYAMMLEDDDAYGF